MKKLKLVSIALFTFSLSTYQLSNHAIRAIAQEDTVRHATVHSVNGEAKIKTVTSSQYLPLKKGMELHFGDLVYSSQGSRVSIQCHDGSLNTLPQGIISGINYVCPGLSQPPRRPTNLWNILFGQ